QREYGINSSDGGKYRKMSQNRDGVLDLVMEIEFSEELKEMLPDEAGK
ncbi:hypothetical protein Tco_1058201, partial [Tanacetum coccineum]